MRVLLDTHAVIWAIEQPRKLGALALAAIDNHQKQRLLSTATVWELSIKVGQGKLTLSLPYADWISKAIADLKLTVLPITVACADRQSRLPWLHKDPFDRMLVAQAMSEAVAVVSTEVIFDAYGVARLWD